MYTGAALGLSVAEFLLPFFNHVPAMLIAPLVFKIFFSLSFFLSFLLLLLLLLLLLFTKSSRLFCLLPALSHI